MGPGQEGSRASDADPIGLLQLVLNCQMFTSCISNRQSFGEVSGQMFIYYHFHVDTKLGQMNNINYVYVMTFLP